jgi:GNAT superfamily N-acetyltransferase
MTVPPAITLRPLNQSQASDLQAVYQGIGDYFEATAGQGPLSKQAETDLREATADDSRYLLGIFLEEHMVGVLDLRLADPGPHDVRLGLIAMTHSHRRQGLGTWALRILEEWLRQETPTEAVVLAIPAQDYPTQAFFHHGGYAFTGQATRVLGGSKRLRLLFMRKELG